MKLLFFGTIYEKTLEPTARMAQLEGEAKSNMYKIIYHEIGKDFIKVTISFFVKAKNEEKAAQIVIDYLNKKTTLNIIKVDRVVKMIDVNDMSVVELKKVNIKETWKND